MLLRLLPPVLDDMLMAALQVGAVPFSSASAASGERWLISRLFARTLPEKALEFGWCKELAAVCVLLQFRDQASNCRMLIAGMGSHLLVSWPAVGKRATPSVEAWIQVPSLGNGLLCSLCTCAARSKVAQLLAASADAP